MTYVERTPCSIPLILKYYFIQCFLLIKNLPITIHWAFSRMCPAPVKHDNKVKSLNNNVNIYCK